MAGNKLVAEPTTTSSVRSEHLARAARDAVLLVARVGLGVLMVWHAKVEYDFGGSVSGVIALFDQSGVPLPTIAGPANLFGELIGGIALILGLGVRVIGVLMALNMAGAWILVHPGALYSLDHTGPELVIALGLLSLVLAVTGSGRLGLDHLIARRAHRSDETGH
ncbi:MAG TPA: DoxX family protein [Pseudonocardiaceae bacterium]|jgi:putative oxidoreductase|nr:DoxX family protein [Pseudonocardiaceae bacterium]